MHELPHVGDEDGGRAHLELQVVGDERAIKVHVHVVDPGEPLSYAVGVGRISDIVVENMQEQMEAIKAL